MKNLIKIFLTLFFLSFFGCKEENGITNPTGNDPFGGGNNGNVSFQVSINQNQQIGAYFHFIPSVDVKIIKVEGTINGQTSIVNGDVNTIITVAEGFSISAINPEAGDQWSFKITGKIASNNSDFTITVNYIIPANFSGESSSVTIEIDVQQGQEGSIEFLFKPNVDIKVTKVDAQMGDFTDELSGDGTTVYSANNWYTLAAYNGVESGQQWSFTFTGTIANNNQNYNVTSTYTVP